MTRWGSAAADGLDAVYRIACWNITGTDCGLIDAVRWFW